MLFLFRKSQRVLLWILLVVVIITFVGFYGKSGLPQREKKQFGTYKNKPVYDDDLRRYIRGALVFRRLANIPVQDTLTNEELEREGIQLMIRVDQAKTAGMVVSDQEVQMMVDRMFPGQVLGNLQAYQGAIVNLVGIQMKPREFEEHIRNILLIEKVRQYLMTSVLITEEEVRQQYDIDNSLIKIAYVPFFFKDYLAGTSATTNEVEAFYNTNPEEFRIPDQVDVLSALVEIDVAGVKIEEDELKEYYEENKDYFVLTNKQAIAEDTSSDIAIDEDSTDEQYKPYEEVKEEIRVKIADQRSIEIASDKMDMLEFALLDSPITEPEARLTVFRQKAKEVDIPLVEPGFLSLEDAIPGVTNSSDVIRAALSMERGVQSPVVAVPGKGFLIFIVQEKKETHIPELVECFPEVASEVKNRRAFETARMMADQVSRMVRSSSNDFVTAVKKQGYTVRTSVPLNRRTGLTDINCPASMIANMFAFPNEFPIVLPFMDGFMVAANIEYIPADFDLLKLSDENNPRGTLSSQSANVLMSFLYAQGEQSFKVIQQPEPPKQDAPQAPAIPPAPPVPPEDLEEAL